VAYECVLPAVEHCAPPLSTHAASPFLSARCFHDAIEGCALWARPRIQQTTYRVHLQQSGPSHTRDIHDMPTSEARGMARGTIEKPTCCVEPTRSPDSADH